MKGKAESDAHVVLNFIISKAVLEGKIGHSTLTIPLAELVDPDEGFDLDEKIQDYALKIRIETSWDSAPLEPHEFDPEFNGDEE
jgi:membrane carboxypeptidase/penicillin-binding protein PbpC